jgi:hypothetical protein
MELIDSSSDLLPKVSTDNSDTDTIQSSQNDAPSEVKLMIRHQFLGVELVSPLYHSDGATCYLSPDQKVDVGSTTQVDFSIDPDQDESAGVLIYRLKRENIDQYNEEAISSEEEATYIQFVMIWKVNSSKELCVYSFLIEHDKDYVWNEVGLMILIMCCGLFNVQGDLIEDTWLIYDNTVLMTSVNVTHEGGCYELDMTISEATIKDNTRRPWYLDLDR